MGSSRGYRLGSSVKPCTKTRPGFPSLYLPPFLEHLYSIVVITGNLLQKTIGSAYRSDRLPFALSIVNIP